MRNSFLFLLTLALFASCESHEIVEEIEIPTESLIDQRFETCYYEDDLAKNKCDSVLISIFGKSIFKRNIHLDLAESTMNCEVDGSIKLIPFGDLNQCIPNSYDLLYSIQEKDNSIFSFRMVAGKDMQFEPVSTIIADHLKGYRKLLDGEFNIHFSQAKKIAVANGVNLDESFIELVMNESGTYHWEAELEYDHNSMVLLLIDLMSGETSKEVLKIVGGSPIN